MCLSHCCLFLLNAAEDWLKPSVILGAFEARAARICVAHAQNLSKFENPEDGMFLYLDLCGSILMCVFFSFTSILPNIQWDHWRMVRQRISLRPP